MYKCAQKASYCGRRERCAARSRVQITKNTAEGALYGEHKENFGNKVLLLSEGTMMWLLMSGEEGITEHLTYAIVDARRFAQSNGIAND